MASGVKPFDLAPTKKLIQKNRADILRGLQIVKTSFNCIAIALYPIYKDEWCSYETVVFVLDETAASGSRWEATAHKATVGQRSGTRTWQQFLSLEFRAEGQQPRQLCDLLGYPDLKVKQITDACDRLGRQKLAKLKEAHAEAEQDLQLKLQELAPEAVAVRVKAAEVAKEQVSKLLEQAQQLEKAQADELAAHKLGLGTPQHKAQSSDAAGASGASDFVAKASISHACVYLQNA